MEQMFALLITLISDLFMYNELFLAIKRKKWHLWVWYFTLLQFRRWSLVIHLYIQSKVSRSELSANFEPHSDTGGRQILKINIHIIISIIYSMLLKQSNQNRVNFDPGRNRKVKVTWALCKRWEAFVLYWSLGGWPFHVLHLMKSQTKL